MRSITNHHQPNQRSSVSRYIKMYRITFFELMENTTTVLNVFFCILVPHVQTEIAWIITVLIQWYQCHTGAAFTRRWLKSADRSDPDLWRWRRDRCYQGISFFYFLVSQYILPSCQTLPCSSSGSWGWCSYPILPCHRQAHKLKPVWTKVWT